jgi:endonuclease/exonuclease/phosphatase family metal-dependent hydrolase
MRHVTKFPHPSTQTTSIHQPKPDEVRPSVAQDGPPTTIETQSADTWELSSIPKTKLRLLTYNIDTNIMRAEDGMATASHPEWRTKQRIQRVITAVGDIIDRKKPGIIHIQEGRKFITSTGEQVDSVTPLATALEQRGYKVVIAPYNQTGDKAFQYLTAFDPDVLKFEEGYHRYINRTPTQPTPHPAVAESEREADEARIKEHNFGTLWERGIYITRFSHKEFKEPVYSINVHLDLPARHRLEASRLLADWVREILAEEPDAKIVMAGDFNTFPDAARQGAQQLSLLRDARFGDGPLLVEASQDLRYPDGRPATSSFVAFPYDFLGVNASSTNIHGTELAALVEQLPSDEMRTHARDTLAGAQSGAFDLSRFLTALEPICRKRMIGLIYAQCRAVGGQLDRSFVRGFDTAKTTVLPFPQFPFPEGAEEDNEKVRQYVLDNHDKGPAFPSDHHPLLSVLKTRRTDSDM